MSRGWGYDLRTKVCPADEGMTCEGRCDLRVKVCPADDGLLGGPGSK